MTMTPQTLLKATKKLIFFEENVRKEVKKNEGKC